MLRIPIGPERWLFGRVVSTDAQPSPYDDIWSNSILLYIFRHVSSTGVPPRPLLAADLLFPPVITSDELWRKRRCELVENRPFDPGEVLAQHCFESMIFVDRRFFDEKGRRLPERVEPCGLQSLKTLYGIEEAIRESMAAGLR